MVFSRFKISETVKQADCYIEIVNIDETPRVVYVEMQGIIFKSASKIDSTERNIRSSYAIALFVEVNCLSTSSASDIQDLDFFRRF